MTRYNGKKRSFADVAETCRGLGHVAIGLQSAGATQLNVPRDVPVEPGTGVITIGPSRLHTID